MVADDGRNALALAREGDEPETIAMLEDRAGA
jgi:hypothetical protein